MTDDELLAIYRGNGGKSLAEVLRMIYDAGVAEQPATPTPSTEQAFELAAAMIERSYDTTQRDDDYALALRACMHNLRHPDEWLPAAIRRAALVSPVSEQPTPEQEEEYPHPDHACFYGCQHESHAEQPAPLDLEPWTCGLRDGWRHAYGEYEVCGPEWNPRPGFEQDQARYEQGGE